MSLITLSATLSNAWGTVWPILFAIVFFGVIIALHEFGHFITAKLFGIRVNEFAIGMGPALFKKRKGEKIKFFWTLARENKAAKEAAKEASNEEAETADVPALEPAEADKTATTPGETTYALRLLPIGGFCALEGEDEASEDQRAFGNKATWKRMIVLAAGAVLNIILGLLLICVMLGNDGSVLTNEISFVSEKAAAEENGLQVGDTILKVDGTRVYSTRDLSYCLFYRTETGSVDLTVMRDDTKVLISGFTYEDAEDGSYFSVTQKEITFLNCGKYAVKETAAMAKLVYLSLLDMIGGKYGLDDISGAVGTVNIVAETTSAAIAERDYSSILFILAFITVNIGIVNLLPLPALDGGRLFFCLIELIFRKPVPKKFEAVVHAIGLVLLLLLMALITFNDIKNIIVS